MGTNDIRDEVDTVKNLQNVINKIKKKSAHRKIAISAAFKRTDYPELGKQIPILNSRLKDLCEDNMVTFLENDNIDETCLGQRKLHPNKKGKAFFANKSINVNEIL